jgi:hypothetical protein
MGWQEDTVSGAGQILSLDGPQGLPAGAVPGVGITGYSGPQLSNNPSSSGSIHEGSLPSELPTAIVSAPSPPQQPKQTRFGATIILGSPQTPGIVDGGSHIDSLGMDGETHALDSEAVTMSQVNVYSQGAGGADGSSGSYSQELLVSEQLARAAPRAPGPGPGR